MTNIVLFATDDYGGAGKAALRIVKALNRIGKNCKMLVKNKQSNDEDVIQVYALSKFSFNKRVSNSLQRRRVNNMSLNNKYYFFGYKYDDIKYEDIRKFIDFTPDTVIVTWISGFLSPSTISEFAGISKASLVLYPMDMSLFTGGCHYAWDCQGFEKDCQQCPAILSDSHKQIAVDRLQDKKASWSGNNVRFWACSSTVYTELKRAALLQGRKVERVFIPIDENVFNDNNRNFSRNIFNISSSDKVILFGSSVSFEERKGIKFFLEAINILSSSIPTAQKKNIKVLIAGRKEKDKTAFKLPFEVIDIDFIKDDLLLSQLYQAADVLVCPSIQDSGPMMINEAQMCGLPVVAFYVGVATDLIMNGASGFLCESVEQIAANIQKVLLGELSISHSDIAAKAKAKTSFFSFGAFINQQEDVYD